MAPARGGALIAAPFARVAPPQLLYVTHSAGYRHEVLPVTKDAVRALGHEAAVWGDERLTRHVLGGIRWAMGHGSE